MLTITMLLITVSPILIKHPWPCKHLLISTKYKVLIISIIITLAGIRSETKVLSVLSKINYVGGDS